MGSALDPGEPKPTVLPLRSWRELDRTRPIDWHMHTTYTDGKASAREMAEAARDAGVREILLSEHVRATSTYYEGFAEEVRALDVAGVRAHPGAEAKVLDLDGTLDCPAAAAENAVAIIGSVHSLPAHADGSPQKWSQLDATEAVARELEHALAIVARSRAHILGHPMGICISRFGVVPLAEIRQIAAACREHGKAFDLNARYCPHSAAWVRIVKEEECLVSIGSDAHLTRQVGAAWKMFVQEVAA